MQKYGRWCFAMLIIYYLTAHSHGASKVSANQLVIVVVTQDAPHHADLTKKLTNHQLLQASREDGLMPIIHSTIVNFPHHGAWTFIPILDSLSLLHGSNSSWIFFCEDRTRINLPVLMDLLGRHDSTEDAWIGYGVVDADSTIIHHFSLASDFRYPMLGSGFAVTTALLNSLAKRLASQGPPEADFSIDSAYELARFVLDSGRGTALTHSSLLCLAEQPHCASYFVPPEPCGKLVANELIHFAVKTCSSFHDDRVATVKQTWAKDAANLMFYSDLEDPRLPSTDLGVPNTVRGHCGKTMAIVRHAATKSNIKWLAIVDDDTLISVRRLQELLSCYDAATPLALGERYGYNVGHSLGYNYITGGGGILVNMAAVRLLADGCHCPSDSTPDDMYLGVCMVRLGIALVHSPQFHQARPPDYSAELLSMQPAVSFHKYWLINPLNVYTHWLAGAQDDMHQEL